MEVQEIPSVEKKQSNSSPPPLDSKQGVRLYPRPPTWGEEKKAKRRAEYMKKNLRKSKII